MTVRELVTLYARVSHIKQRVSAMESDTRSVDQQMAALRELSATQGWYVVVELRDSGASASQFALREREEFQVLRRLVREGRTTLIAAWEVSRFERVTSDWSELLDACAEAGVRLWYSGRVIDPRDPADRWAATIDGTAAEREVELTSARARRGIESAAREGRPHGKPPYGLTKGMPDAQGRPTWTVDMTRVTASDTPAMIVREVITRVALGEPINRIKRDLDVRGVPTPGARQAGRNGWNRQTIRDMAFQVAYLGRVERQTGSALPPGRTRTVEAPARWPALIDEATCRQAQERLASRATGRVAELKYALTGVVTCGVCDEPLRGARNVHKDRGNYVNEIYVCRSHHVSRSVSQLDRYVTVLLKLRTLCPDLAQSLERDTEATREATARRDEAASRIAEWRAAAEQGRIGPDEYNRFTRRWSSQLIAAEREISRAADDGRTQILLDPDLLHRWPDMSPEERRTVFGTVFSSVVVLPQSANRFDPRHVAVQWRGEAGLLRGDEVGSYGAELRDAPTMEDVAAVRWSRGQREKIGWSEPRYAWADGWYDVALGTAWHGLL